MLAVNYEAAELHGEALQALKAGDVALAHSNLLDALSMLPAVPKTTDEAVQIARLARDEVFTTGRIALQQARPQLDPIIDSMKSVLSMTARYASGKSPMAMGEALRASTKQERREVISEHAATLGALHRLIYARQVVNGSLAEGTTVSSQTLAEQQYLGMAYDMAKVGVNQYYAANVASIGIRSERGNGRLLHTVPWLSRAAMSTVRAGWRDRTNLAAAVRTVAHHTWEARTRRTALAAARHWKSA